MPDKGHRIYAIQTVRVSKQIEAPLRYVFDWCTDYREDDWKLSSRRPRVRYKVLKLSPGRLLRIRSVPFPGKEPRVALDRVRLTPPDRWHTDQLDEDDFMSADYHLTKIARTTTRFDLMLTERWLIRSYQSTAETRRQASDTWDRFAAQIEARYRAGKPPRG